MSWVNLVDVFSHPYGDPIQRVDLVTDELIILTTFTVCRDDLFRRIMEIKGLWPFASDDERNALFQEIMDIKGVWPHTPDF